jgi:TctA family transporter
MPNNKDIAAKYALIFGLFISLLMAWVFVYCIGFEYTGAAFVLLYISMFFLAPIVCAILACLAYILILKKSKNSLPPTP